MWVYVKDLKKYIDQEVELKGWVWRSRSSGKIAFINLRDGTGIVQVVVEASSVNEETFNNANC